MKTVKCVVWDLDNTLWDGILLEDTSVTLRPEAREVIEALDARGILHSVASRNDPASVERKLDELGLRDYFLHPQVHWGSKVPSIEAIAKALNIGLDAIAFVDDQPFERDEVAHALPAVRTIDAAELALLPSRPDMTPAVITPDARRRREMYRADLVRAQAESEHQGAREDFLASLGMRMRIAPAVEGDLLRAEELTVRTNQLNATGRTYSYDELKAYSESPDHLLLVAELEDRYGTYGKIGLALVEKRPDAWTVLLLLMSCRVMSRGVGSILMAEILRRAREAGARLLAHFVDTGKNRMMYVTYKFGGFKEVGREGDVVLFEHPLAELPAFPPHVEIHLS